MRGFTLLEMLLSVALIALIAGMGTPLYQALQVRTDLDIAAASYAHALRFAEVRARGVDGDASWGVRVATTTDIVLFQGASYAARNSTYDETYDLPVSVTVSGQDEIVFAKFTGIPGTTGTTTLTSTTGDVREIGVNAQGTVSYWP